MLDFDLTEEQRAFQRLAREFAVREIRPIAMELDRSEVPGNFPWDLVRKGSKLGLRTLALPPEWGGLGADAITQLVMIDQMAYEDVSCSKIFSQNWKICRYLSAGGTEEQKQRFLPAFRDNDTFLLSLPITEADSGADNHDYYDAPPGEGVMTTARREGDQYVISGRKQFISHGATASLYIVRVRTDPSAPVSKGISHMLVPRDTPGVSVGTVYDKLGWRAYQQAELIFEDVRVPVENLLGGREGYLEPEVMRYGLGAIEVPAHLMALARAALDEAVRYANGRRQGGKIIMKHQAVAEELAELFTLLEAGRSLLWRAAWTATHREPDRALFRCARIFCAEAARKICIGAMETFGAYGVMREMPIQKLVRDALTMQHGEGTTRVQKLSLAKIMESRFEQSAPLVT